VGVVVVGETPYAEFFGDRESLTLAPEDHAAIANLKKAGLRVVVVVISGRPLALDEALGEADAVVAAWLPGTEGQGVADVLFGDYKPTGKLSFAWPHSAQHARDAGAGSVPEPLFARGFGLSY
jgi:beta-glucosidase